MSKLTLILSGLVVILCLVIYIVWKIMQGKSSEIKDLKEKLSTANENVTNLQDLYTETQEAKKDEENLISSVDNNDDLQSAADKLSDLKPSRNS